MPIPPRSARARATRWRLSIKTPSPERDAPDDHLVSLRSDDVSRALASIVGCAELIDDQCHLNMRNLLRQGRRLIALVDNALALQRF